MGKYQLMGNLPSESRAIDLTQAWCARVSLPLAGH
jgi:hypothetical protein